LAVEIHENFDICQAFVLFLATIKLAELLKINRRVGCVVTSMADSLRDLTGFALFFAIIYMAFCRLVTMLLLKILMSVGRDS